jgi:hypothetical protein
MRRSLNQRENWRRVSRGGEKQRSYRGVFCKSDEAGRWLRRAGVRESEIATGAAEAVERGSTLHAASTALHSEPETISVIFAPL